MVAVAACSKDEGKAAGEESGTAVAAKSATSGSITVERLEQANGEIEPGMTWEDAHARLLATVGEPMFAVSKHTWYVLEGDKCHELAVETVDGRVHSVSVSSGDGASLMEKCQKAAAE